VPFDADELRAVLRPDPLGLGRFAPAPLALGNPPDDVVAPGETVAVAILRAGLGDAERTALLLVSCGLVLPKAEPKDLRTSGPGLAGPLVASLGRVAVAVQPVLRAGRLSLGDLTDMRSGTTVLLDAAAGVALDLRVGGEPVFTGRVAREGTGASFVVASRRDARRRTSAGGRT
jgi:hypothetical protein